MATYPTPPNQGKQRKRKPSASSAGQRKRTPMGPQPRGSVAKSTNGKLYSGWGPKQDDLLKFIENERRLGKLRKQRSITGSSTPKDVMKRGQAPKRIPKAKTLQMPKGVKPRAQKAIMPRGIRKKSY